MQMTRKLDKRLAARALVLSIDSGYDDAQAVAALLALAGDNEGALKRAVLRLRSGTHSRPSVAADRAAQLLERALAAMDGPTPSRSDQHA